MSMTRRSFLQRTALSGLTIGAAITGTKRAAQAADMSEPLTTVIDLNKCNGCPDLDTPRCVAACRNKNNERFPQPIKPIQDYWPQTKHEDWSEKQNLTNRLTPYNWTYVQHITVEHNGKKQNLHIPRRCMHCNSATCADLCPFGVIDQTAKGPVVINTGACFGGAKCRDVCPWHIPQRQAGVGIYLDIAPTYAGGGVMYKCDLCADLLEKGQEPACVSACPTGALMIGPRRKMEAYADKWRADNNGYIYGRDENGGTSTFYLSKVPFGKINEALLNQEIDEKPGRPAMPPGIDNPLHSTDGAVKSMLVAPFAGLAAAGISTYKIMTKGEKENENSEA